MKNNFHRNQESNSSSVINLVKQMESEYLEKLQLKLEGNFLNFKIIELNNLRLTIENSKSINKEILNKIRALSISKGGFLLMENRQILWKKIFGMFGKTHIKKLKFIEIVQKEKKNNQFILKEYSDHIVDNKEIRDIDIMERDIKRTSINQLDYFCCKNSPDFSKEINLIRSNLSGFLKRFFSLNKTSYEYYQGFHEIAVYILLIYFDSMSTGLSILQRIGELYLKDYLDCSDKEKNSDIFNTIILILKETIKQINKTTYDFLETDKEGTSIAVCVSWILCLFSQKIHNINIIHRLFDYLFCSHPLTVYYIAANIIIDEFEVFAEKKIGDFTFIEHISRKTFENFDFDKIIEKSESNLKKIQPENIIKHFHEKLIPNSPFHFKENDTMLLLHDIYLDKEKSYQWEKYKILRTFLMLLILGIAIFTSYYYLNI